MLLFMVSILVLLPEVGLNIPVTKCGTNNPLSIKHKHYRPGDLLIGGIIPQFFVFIEEVTFQTDPSAAPYRLPLYFLQNYQQILALVFAVEEINENPHILPNISLGFSVSNNYFTAGWTYLASMELLSTHNRFIPNYKCDAKDSVVSVVTGPNPQFCEYVATALHLYKIPQFIYGSAPLMDNTVQTAFFHRMFPNDHHQNQGILRLLLFFNWTWIGVVYIENNSGQRFIQNIVPMFFENGVCFAFVIPLNKESYFLESYDMAHRYLKIYKQIMEDTATVVIIHGENQVMFGFRLMIYMPDLCGTQAKSRLWILTAQMEFTTIPFLRGERLDVFHGAIFFAVPSKEVAGFQTFLQSRNPLSEKEDGLVRIFWEEAFECKFPSATSKEKTEKACTGEERLENLPGSEFEMRMTSQSYSVYNAVYAVAHALQAMHSTRFNLRAVADNGRQMLLTQHLWKLHHFVRGVSFNNSVEENISFDENGEIEVGFDIINWIAITNDSFQRVKVGKIDPKVPPDKQLHISAGDIIWPQMFNQAQPISLCNERCNPGYIKLMKKGKPFCCYDCLPCPEGEISVWKDMTECFQCEEDQFPNNDKNQCIQKHIDFLSYEEPLGISLGMVALSFAFTTALVLGIFLKYSDTPIVKANNRNLSYTLLVALLLAFLSTLLFIGQPHKWRQTQFCLTDSLQFWLEISNNLVAKCVTGDPLSIKHRHYHSGDLLIAGIISHIYRFSDLVTFRRHPSAEQVDELMFFIQNFQHVLALIFAVEEINENPHILPNITLGVDVFNNYFVARWTYLASMELLSTHDRLIPNYKCDDQDNTVSVIVGPNPQFCLYVATVLHLFKVPQDAKFEEMSQKSKIWIMTAQMEFTSLSVQRDFDIDFFHGAISFVVSSKEILGFQQFLQTRNPASENKDNLMRIFWELVFECSFPSATSNENIGNMCTGEEKLETLPGSVFEISMTGQSYSVYNAVYAVAHALQALHSSKVKRRGMRNERGQMILNQQLWQLHHYLRRVSFNNSAGGKVSFNQNGELETDFDIINWVTFPNLSFLRVKVGKINSHVPSEKMLSISASDLTWPNIFNQIYMISDLITSERHPSEELVDDLILFSQNYQHILALVFVVNEINENPRILPNVTMGVNIYNSYFSASWTYLASMQLLSRKSKSIPNYKCGFQYNPTVVIGGPNSNICLYMATILCTYKIPQIMYGSAPVMNIETQGVFFYKMFPSRSHQYSGILQLLLHFSWTWIGVIYLNDDNGERHSEEDKGVDYDSSDGFHITTFSKKLEHRFHPCSSSNKETVKFCTGKEKLETLPDSVFEMKMTSHSYSIYNSVYAVAYALHAMHSSNINDRTSVDRRRGMLLNQKPWQSVEKEDEKTCTGEEKLEPFPTSLFETGTTAHSYSIYNAVSAVAHALHAMHSSSFKGRTMRNVIKQNFFNQKPWQHKNYCKMLLFSELLEKTVSPGVNGSDYGKWVMKQHYQHILALVFALKEINENTHLLPNITLGFNIYNNDFRATTIYLASMELLSTKGKFYPNYKCDALHNVKAVFGGPNSYVGLQMANVLSVYKLPQFIYGSALTLDIIPQRMFFHQMFPNAAIQYEGILQLLLHFRWMWTGVLYLDDQNGEWFVQNVLPNFSLRGICFDFIEKFPPITFSKLHAEMHKWVEIIMILMNSTANALVVHGEIQTMVIFRTMLQLSEKEGAAIKTKVWIMTAQMDLTSFPFLGIVGTEFIHGYLLFSMHSKELLGFQKFIQRRNPTLVKEDGFIRVFWEQAFGCLFPVPEIHNISCKICTGEERLESLPTSVFEMKMSSHSYSIYNGVYAVAHALNAIAFSSSKHRARTEGRRLQILITQPWQLHHFLRSISFNNNAGERFSFDESGSLAAGFDIINLVTSPNKSFLRVKVGKIDIQDFSNKMFTICEDAITWPIGFNKPQRNHSSKVLKQHYQHILALQFALKEINENPQLLPNITLGIKVYNNDFRATTIYLASMELLSTKGHLSPNYKCDVLNNVVANIGGPNSDVGLNMATILSIYKLPQLTYGSALMLDTIPQGAFFHQMFPNVAIQYEGILQLLLHFEWTWTGVLYLDDDNGERFVLHVLPKFSQSGICFDFIERFLPSTFSEAISQMEEWIKIVKVLMNSTANVLVVHGEIQTMIILRMMLQYSESEGVNMMTKVWIMTAQMDLASFPFLSSWGTEFIHGSILFAMQSKELLGFQKFIQTINPTLTEEDGFSRAFWEHAFDCSFPVKGVDNMDSKICTGEEKLESLASSIFEMKMTSHSYSIYNAIYALAHALNAINLSASKHRTRREGGKSHLLNLKPWQIHHFLKSVLFNNSAGQRVTFDENGSLAAGFDIINWVTFPNQSFRRVKVGKIDTPGNMFSIFEKGIEWPKRFNQVQPLSLCNDKCHLGSHKAKSKSGPFCCYDCHPCPEGKISNKTALVLKIFIKHQDTPIHILALVFAVKEINENLKILPNISVGFQIYDNQFTARSTYLASMQLLSIRERFIPNYKCDIHNIPVAVIGGPDSNVCVHLTPTLALYKIPQLTYGSAPVLDNKVQGAFVHQMFPDETHQYMGILHLLQYFSWTWIGVLYFDDENGQKFIQNVLPIFSENGICFDFIKGFLKEDYSTRIVHHVEEAIKMYEIVMDSTASVLVVHGSIQTLLVIGILLHISKSIDIPTKAGEEKLGSLPSSVLEMSMTAHSYNIYNVVFAVVYALQSMESSLSKKRVMVKGQNCEILKQLPWQLYHFMKYVSFNNSAGEKISFDQNGALKAGFDIINWITFPNKSFVRARVGTVNPHASQDNIFTISENDIMWPNCFNQEPLGVSLVILSLSFALLTSLVLGIFIKYQDTAIVKANNRTLSYVLFISLLLSFSCAFLFMGHPDDVTCFLRQSAFGVIFTVALSCVLAKTITVVLAFKATKPGSKMRKWVGKPLANYIALSCSFIQAIIYVVWLIKFPPLPEFDRHSMVKEIVLDYIDDCFQCPEGQYPNNSQNLCIPKDVTFLSYNETLGTKDENLSDLQHIQALEFAIKEINQNPQILPNITLGFLIYNNNCRPELTSQVSMELLSTQGRFIPNYRSDYHNNLVAVIGGPHSDICHHMSTILSIYKIPQLIYSPSPVINKSPQYVLFHGMSPNATIQFMGILQLLLHFRWMWIGVASEDNDEGEKFVQNLVAIFSQYGICFDFIKRLPELTYSTDIGERAEEGFKTFDTIIKGTASVVVLHGAVQTMIIFQTLVQIAIFEDIAVKKLWIMTAQMDFMSISFQWNSDIQFIHGALSFASHSKEVAGFQKFLQMKNPILGKEDAFLVDLWQQVFKCSFSSSAVENTDGSICTGQEKLETLPNSIFDTRMTAHSYSIYNVIHAVAHALHDMQSSILEQRRMIIKVGRIDPDKVLTIFEDAITWPKVFNQNIGHPVVTHHNYRQSGDLFIAGILSQIFISTDRITYRKNPSGELEHDMMVITQNYQHLLALTFAVKEINANPFILPNITLGFYISNSNFISRWTILASMELLSTWNKFIPNYKCDIQNNPVAVIGGPNSDVCLFIAEILCIYKFPQVTYGSAPLMDNKNQAVFVHRMFPNWTHQYMGILHVILHFRWAWIGIIYLDNEIGESELDRIMEKAIETAYLVKRSTANAVILHHFLKSVSFNNSAGEKVSFNENGDLVAGFDIINWVTFPNESFLRVKVGRIDPQTLPNTGYTIHEDAIIWPSRFNQVQYMDDCLQCPDDHYPSKTKDFCIPKSLTFLGFEDSLGTSLAISALFLFCLTALVLGVFIKHQNTPIVRANNRNLTYTLLLSLLLSFLCALLFIGQPQKMTCLFRQTAFGIIFSVAVSSVLAKTIIVVLAFLATKPESKLKKWARKRMATSIVLFCLVIQVTICIVWLTTFPPFPNLDVNSMAEEVILELPKNYQHALSLVFAVKKINENPRILPNISLGFHIYDSHFHPKMTYQNTLNLLFSQNRTVLNYNCDGQKNPVAIIGGHDFETSLHIATILGLYKIPQWKWVGVIAMGDDKGEMFAKTITHLLYENDICNAFIKKIPILGDIGYTFGLLDNLQNLADFLSRTNVNVSVVYANTHSMLCFQTVLNLAENNTKTWKLWIMTSDWDFSSEIFHRSLDAQVLHGALSFAILSNEVQNFRTFLQTLNPYSDTDGFIRIFWEQAFVCTFSDTDTDVKSERCTGKEKLEDLPGPFFEMNMTGQSYNIYNAVYAVAYALHAMYSSRMKYKEMVVTNRLNIAKSQHFQLHDYLRTISFNNSAGDKVSLDETSDLAAGFDIINWIIFPNQSFTRVKVGRMDFEAPTESMLSIDETIITWHSRLNQVVLEQNFYGSNISKHCRNLTELELNRFFFHWFKIL
ncbi:hypothetical protein JD844_001156 [Phrynosoma platyrhinos]|uniref:G-protein coupled receptors family 3 profile domain-containing protein n=1 Tax=Phrynosoma platyrhinos TaxID=52577 RepID=A0ABQ7T9X2_PHRPL|nr:hypothetical protein JD844_001156 [Phrynosoma platyrhinos]